MLLGKLSQPNPQVMSNKRKVEEIKKAIKAGKEKRHKRGNTFTLEVIDSICHDD